MDVQDLQDDRRSDYQFGEITEKIIGCAFDVMNGLGTGFFVQFMRKPWQSLSRTRDSECNARLFTT